MMEALNPGKGASEFSLLQAVSMNEASSDLTNALQVFCSQCEKRRNSTIVLDVVTAAASNLMTDNLEVFAGKFSMLMVEHL
jgi:hypothetical protein